MLAFILALSQRAWVTSALDSWQLFRHSNAYLDYGQLVVMLPTFAGACVVVAAWYFVASPAQDARLLEWVAKLAPQRLAKFDWTLLDRDDPNFDVPTGIYLWRRLGARR